MVAVVAVSGQTQIILIGVVQIAFLGYQAIVCPYKVTLINILKILANGSLIGWLALIYYTEGIWLRYHDDSGSISKDKQGLFDLMGLIQIIVISTMIFLFILIYGVELFQKCKAYLKFGKSRGFESQQQLQNKRRRIMLECEKLTQQL